MNNATAVPSLNKLSPSNIIVKRFGAPYSLNNANTATVSVDEIIATGNSATMNGISSPMSGRTKYTASDISNVDISNPPIASSVIAQALSSIFRIFILNADSKMSTGKKIKNSNSGVSCISSKNPNTPSKYGNFTIGTSSKPASTSKTVYGTLNRFAAKNIADDNASSVNNDKTDVILSMFISPSVVTTPTIHPLPCSHQIKMICRYRNSETGMRRILSSSAFGEPLPSLLDVEINKSSPTIVAARRRPYSLVT